MQGEWFTLISEVARREDRKISQYTLEFPEGVSNEELRNAERTLGFKLPDELKSLLLEFDGIPEYTITDVGEKIQVGSIIWGLAAIVKFHFSWTIPAKAKLFSFGGSISGNNFGYLIVDGKPDQSQIWQSDHETEIADEEMFWRASSLKEFISTSLIESRWY